MTMTLEDALRELVPFARADGFDAAAVRHHLATHEAARSLHAILGEAILHGRLTARCWAAATGGAPPDDVIAGVGRLWDSLLEAWLVHPIEGTPQAWTPETLRLWAYTEGWELERQDEDLILMQDVLVPDLLEIAAERDCPKRRYLLNVVEHWARDGAHAAVGTDAFADLTTRLARLEEPARAAGDDALADYLRRLAGYGRPARVDREGAERRGADLTRCAPRPADLRVTPEGRHWVVVLPGSVPALNRTITIARADGRIR